MRESFINSIKQNQNEFGLSLPGSRLEILAQFYELIQKHNEILHLVAPTTTEEFVKRHILESLTLLDFLPSGSVFADIGTGAGLPSVPCLIVREDLRGILIESKLKKAGFLEKVLQNCGLKDRAEILNRQFQEIEPPDVSHVTCRALDKFTKRFPKILKWTKGRKLLFFGGQNLATQFTEAGIKFEQKLLPLSEKRFLFIAQN